ncbi:MAG: GNAT family N-acetyltransferase, partial [Gemmatimonadota bacterium]|nr:GNAT family N-acetyltransferase [Gemmatimonadota bacterium]
MNGELTKQDVDAIAEFRRDPRYLEYYYRPAYTREECVRFVDKCIAWSKENPRCKFQFAITDRSNGVLLGDCGIRT